MTLDCLKCFGKLIPETMHHVICIESDQYLPPTKCRILSILPHVAVPQPSEKIFRIDFTEDTNEVHVKWLGALPTKCKFNEKHTLIRLFMASRIFITDPSLLTKVLKSIDEKLFTDPVLLKQIRVLVEEWKKYEHITLKINHLIPFD